MRPEGQVVSRGSGRRLPRSGHLVPAPLLAVLVALLLTLVAAGCGAVQDDEVATAAAAFETAVAAADGPAACELLAPATRAALEETAGSACATALLDEGLPHGSGDVQVAAYGTAAQVRFRDDTLFLARFQQGWRVLAAGCRPTPRGVYDCAVEAG